MNKLKTLKDLTYSHMFSKNNIHKVCDVDELKAEAIKCAKDNDSSHICTCCGKWLDFLNITREDLEEDLK